MLTHVLTQLKIIFINPIEKYEITEIIAKLFTHLDDYSKSLSCVDE